MYCTAQPAPEASGFTVIESRIYPLLIAAKISELSLHSLATDDSKNFPACSTIAEDITRRLSRLYDSISC
jgi:hypothetical protein